MNKGGVNIFLSSASDPDGTPSSFTVPIPPIELKEGSEIALTEIILPDEQVIETIREFTLQKIFQGETTNYLKLKVNQCRTVQELVNHLNNQIHELVKMRDDDSTLAHVIFSASENGCIIGRGSKTDITVDDTWLGFSDRSDAEMFGNLLGFDEDSAHGLFSNSPRGTHEGSQPPPIVWSSFLIVKTNLLGDEPLRTIEAGENHLVFKDKVYKHAIKGPYTGINIKIVNSEKDSPVNFKSENCLVVLNLKEKSDG